MIRGQRVMGEKLRLMDILVEVHDSRIPISGRNVLIREKYTAAKPHILLLNKCDLVDTSYNDQVERHLIKNQGINRILYTDLSGHASSKSFKPILPTIFSLVESHDRYNRADSPEINIMVVGIPNVGKSSFINRIRSLFGLKKPAKVGSSAGVTRAVQERIKLSGHPPVYMYDTPGIMSPKYTSIESYMKIALVACLDDQVIGHELIADFGLYWLNRNRKFSYVDFYELEGATDDISEVLFKICVRKNLFSKKGQIHPHFSFAAQVFLDDFRTGKLGKFMLDCDEFDNRINEDIN